MEVENGPVKEKAVPTGNPMKGDGNVFSTMAPNVGPFRRSGNHRETGCYSDHCFEQYGYEKGKDIPSGSGSRYVTFWRGREPQQNESKSC